MSKFLTATLCFLVGIAQADTITINPSKDNTLYETSTQALSNGAGDFIFAGRTQQGNNDTCTNRIAWQTS